MKHWNNNFVLQHTEWVVDNILGVVSAQQWIVFRVEHHHLPCIDLLWIGMKECYYNNLTTRHCALLQNTLFRIPVLQAMLQRQHDRATKPDFAICIMFCPFTNGVPWYQQCFLIYQCIWIIIAAHSTRDTVLLWKYGVQPVWQYTRLWAQQVKMTEKIPWLIVRREPTLILHRCSITLSAHASSTTSTLSFFVHIFTRPFTYKQECCRPVHSFPVWLLLHCQMSNSWYVSPFLQPCGHVLIVVYSHSLSWSSLGYLTLVKR